MIAANWSQEKGRFPSDQDRQDIATSALHGPKYCKAFPCPKSLTMHCKVSIFESTLRRRIALHIEQSITLSLDGIDKKLFQAQQ